MRACQAQSIGVTPSSITKLNMTAALGVPLSMTVMRRAIPPKTTMLPKI